MGVERGVYLAALISFTIGAGPPRAGAAGSLFRCRTVSGSVVFYDSAEKKPASCGAEEERTFQEPSPVTRPSAPAMPTAATNSIEPIPTKREEEERERRERHEYCQTVQDGLAELIESLKKRASDTRTGSPERRNAERLVRVQEDNLRRSQRDCGTDRRPDGLWEDFQRRVTGKPTNSSTGHRSR